MRIAVAGLGYVGCVSAASLASQGHDVVGVDVDPTKIDLIRRGRTPVSEEGLAELVASTVAAGRLTATADVAGAVAATDISLVCVGTPSRRNGSLDTSAVERVSAAIGRGLRAHRGRHTVVVRSTVLPGTTEELVIPVLEQASGLNASEDFGVAMNPEFLREGTSVRDFRDPPKTVIGQLDEASGAAVSSLYEQLSAPLFRVTLREAELLKYVDNAFHALKVGFANEIGAIAGAFGVDAEQLMRVFRADTKLNISAAYLKPGFAFGGSCLPKDLRALVHAARARDVDVPILGHVLPSNEAHLARAVERVLLHGTRRIGLFGLSFKSGTDDLRESPLVELAERLIGKGHELRIYDPDVSVARLLGTNRRYVEERLPHLSSLLVETPDAVVEHADLCILGRRFPEAEEALGCADGDVIDLARPGVATPAQAHEAYAGLPA